MIPPRLLYVLFLFSMTDCAIRYFLGHLPHPILSGCPMDTLARFRLEAAKTGPVDSVIQHCGLAIGLIGIRHWQQPPMPKASYCSNAMRHCRPPADPFGGIASRKDTTPSHQAISLGRLPVLQRPCFPAWPSMTWRRARSEWRRDLVDSGSPDPCASTNPTAGRVLV